MEYSGTYENLKKTLLSIGIVFLVSSCDSDRQSVSNEIKPLHPPPLTIPLNNQGGYTINPVTGDSIQHIINSLGDTLKTGVPVPARGKVIDPDSVAKPMVVPAGKPEEIPTNLEVPKIWKNLTVIPVNKDLLKSFTTGLDTSSFVLINSTGDTVPTGVPIPAKGKVVPCIQPQPVKALAPNIKDNANINLKCMDVDQGMNSSYVLSILEDRHGNLWFGTWGGGVTMYNGETYTHFTEKEGLSNDIVRSIFEDSIGNLWFGTDGGICVYNGETFIHFTQKEGLSNNWVMSVLEDSHGNLWFGTHGGGVNMYNYEAFTHFTKKDGLSNNWVTYVLEDRQGNLWFGTWKGGVSMYNGETFTHFTKKDGLSNNWVTSILEDSHGNLWFGTRGGGIHMYNGEIFTHFVEKEGLSNNIIMSIFEDSHNNIWLGTWGAGVNIYNGASFTHFTENEGLSNNSIRSIIEDSYGNLWFGTNGGGVSKYDGETFTHFTKKEGLSNRYVMSILEDGQGNLWFGTWGGGVSMYNGDTFTHYTVKEGLGNNNVYFILEDSHGDLWFGTDGGVSLYNGENFTHFTEKEGLSNNYVYTILEDTHNNLWIGTDAGVSMYNGETFTHFTEKEGLSNNIILSILEDSFGNLWFGTRNAGVSMYNGETFTHFTQKEGLSNSMVWSILEDRNRNIWISTEKGLNQIVFDPVRVSGTNMNLSAYNTVIHTYSKQDGLKGVDFLPNSMLLDSKNRMWLGSGKCLTMLDMNSFRFPVEPPDIHLNWIDINEQFADYRHLDDGDGMKMEFNGIARFFNFPLNLELPYKSNHLTFHFSAIDWSAPHKIKFSYKMEGLKEEWSLPTVEAKADYRNLAHGTYTFKVRAIGALQKWSETFEYSFTILPPLWLTWWAKAGYGMTALLLIFSIVHWRTARLKQSHKELERKVKKRTTEIHDKNEELRRQKEELQTILENLKTTQSQLIQSEKMASIGQLVAGIAHEINNPVTFISAGVDSLNTNLEEVRQVLDIYHKITPDNAEEKLKEIENLKEKIEYKETIREINKLIDSVKTGTERTTEIVKGLRTFSRLDEDVLKIADIHEGLDSSLILLRNKYKQRIEINKNYGDIPEIECYLGQLNQVFMNILSNAIDAIDDRGTITISTSKSNGSIKVSIKDTGSGIPEDIQSKIFEPFFTTKEIGQGTGLGLSICHSIIAKHRGSIEVKCEFEKGSEFVIVLPVVQSK